MISVLKLTAVILFAAGCHALDKVTLTSPVKTCIGQSLYDGAEAEDQKIDISVKVEVGSVVKTSALIKKIQAIGGADTRAIEEAIERNDLEAAVKLLTKLSVDQWVSFANGDASEEFGIVQPYQKVLEEAATEDCRLTFVQSVIQEKVKSNEVAPILLRDKYQVCVETIQVIDKATEKPLFFLMGDKPVFQVTDTDEKNKFPVKMTDMKCTPSEESSEPVKTVTSKDSSASSIHMSIMSILIAVFISFFF